MNYTKTSLKYSDFEIANLQDSYTLFYGFLAQNILELPNGEAILREAIRCYGIDRGLAMRKKHQHLGVKINMHSLFSVAPDLPADPRFKRQRQRFNEQVYSSHALKCPMADVWKDHGMETLGRIYCEEFHFACYNSYGFGKTRVEMTHTLTQDDDELCVGVYELNPQSLPDSLKVQAFADYDPTYVEPILNIPEPDPKWGFGMLCLKIYYHLFDCAFKWSGDLALCAIEHGLIETAVEAKERICKTEDCYDNDTSIMRLTRNNPLPYPELESSFWNEYQSELMQSFLQDFYFKNLIGTLTPN